MPNFQFISHEYCHDDEYTKEIVYLCLEGKFRVAYVRKKTNTGAMFWSVPSISISKGGKKEYYPAFMQDSNFLEKDIKTFLDSRAWEGRNVFTQPSAVSAPTNAGQTQTYQPRSPAPGSDLNWTVNLKSPQSMSEVAAQDDLPF